MLPVVNSPYGTMDEAKKVLERALEKFKPLLNAKG